MTAPDCSALLRRGFYSCCDLLDGGGGFFNGGGLLFGAAREAVSRGTDLLRTGCDGLRRLADRPDRHRELIQRGIELQPDLVIVAIEFGIDPVSEVLLVEVADPLPEGADGFLHHLHSGRFCRCAFGFGFIYVDRYGQFHVEQDRL